MPNGPLLIFGDCCLDPDAERLWRGGVERRLRAKSFAVLRHLAWNRGRLVTKEELLRTCWPGTSVSDTVLRVCVREIRAALEDDAFRPTFVATVGRRGYRLVAGPDARAPEGDALVGRARSLARLREHLDRARGGRRQVLFVTGEPGIGKTALLEHFAQRVRAEGRVRLAFGQCVDLAGPPEAYVVLLDLLGRLCDGPDGRTVVATLRRWAPSWLLQLPAALDAGAAEALRRRVPHPSRERMLLELAEALEALASDRPLVLLLEDLHWSDAATIDALSYVAQRTLPARLLVVGTYRPTSLVLGDHPLRSVKQGLHARQRCAELTLERLSQAYVGTYLAQRLDDHPMDPAVPAAIHRRTGGNPLFLTATVDHLLERGILTASSGRWALMRPLAWCIPDSLRQLAERQIEAVRPDERKVLEAACVVGVAFPVAPVAAACGWPPARAEGVFARLAARGQLVSAAGTVISPDGTAGGRYEFAHRLYREVLYDRLAPASRLRLHHIAAERLEAGRPGRTREVAASLAAQFSHAGDDGRAAHYHAEAAMAARARFAHR